jgi:hypothetical protein
MILALHCISFKVKKHTSIILIDHHHYFFLARASFAQERIVLDEQIRFSSQDNNNMNVIPLLYRLLSSTNHISITRLHQAIIIKHSILRTALYLDTNGIIMQHCLDVRTVIDVMKLYNFAIFNLRYSDDRDIGATIKEILSHSDLFDLSKGRVIYCHTLRQYYSDDDLPFEAGDQLTRNDLILFSIDIITIP